MVFICILFNLKFSLTDDFRPTAFNICITEIIPKICRNDFTSYLLRDLKIY